MFLNVIVGGLPATDRKLQEIKSSQETDSVCQKLTQYCQHGWPERHRMEGEIKKYIPVKDELSVSEGLLFIGEVELSSHKISDQTSSTNYILVIKG